MNRCEICGVRFHDYTRVLRANRAPGYTRSKLGSPRRVHTLVGLLRDARGYSLTLTKRQKQGCEQGHGRCGCGFHQSVSRCPWWPDSVREISWVFASIANQIDSSLILRTQKYSCVLPSWPLLAPPLGKEPPPDCSHILTGTHSNSRLTKAEVKEAMKDLDDKEFK